MTANTDRTSKTDDERIKDITVLPPPEHFGGLAAGERGLVLSLITAFLISGGVILAIGGDPIEAIKFRMEQAGMTVKDLVPYIGPLNRVYEVLSYKRSLSLSMIRRLSEGLHIPAEVLIRESVAIAA